MTVEDERAALNIYANSDDPAISELAAIVARLAHEHAPFSVVKHATTGETISTICRCGVQL